MAPKTKEKVTKVQEQDEDQQLFDQQSGEIIVEDTAPSKQVTIHGARLPYHPAIEERFGVDKAGWRVLVEATFPSAKSPESVLMALAYCKARNLDVFKKPVHIVPMWSSAVNGYVETVWPGIAELRTTAHRTGQYAGCDEVDFGPTVKTKFKGRKKVKGNWVDAEVEVSYPEWARMTVYRLMGTGRCKFAGPKVKWVESYATIGASDLPNDMWETRPEGQLEKCAEAAALRRAFPEELGNVLTAEEMEGRRLTEGGGTPIPAGDEPPAPEPAKEPAREPDKATQQPAKEPEKKPDPKPDPKPEPQPEPDSDLPPEPEGTNAPAAKLAGKGNPAPDPAEDPETFFQWVDKTLGAAKDIDRLSEVWDAKVEEPMKLLKTKDDRDHCLGLYHKHEQRFEA